MSRELLMREKHRLAAHVRSEIAKMGISLDELAEFIGVSAYSLKMVNALSVDKVSLDNIYLCATALGCTISVDVSPATVNPPKTKHVRYVK